MWRGSKFTGSPQRKVSAGRASQTGGSLHQGQRHTQLCGSGGDTAAVWQQHRHRSHNRPTSQPATRQTCSGRCVSCEIFSPEGAKPSLKLLVVWAGHRSEVLATVVGWVHIAAIKLSNRACMPMAPSTGHISDGGTAHGFSTTQKTRHSAGPSLLPSTAQPVTVWTTKLGQRVRAGRAGGPG